MLESAPHKLQLLVITPEKNDEYNRPIPGTGSERWEEVTICFCHDNSQQKEESVNGKLWVYNYHVVYEGDKIALGSHIRCLDAEGNTVGEGDVKKNAECHSEELEGRCDIWI
ncbi:hypothetical protein [Bacteroides finegoldii]|uniref:hypothetical protein n=1 Tax=Bacteroides finegoldii TaxID=338188 RepID=UPI00265D4156|nr:hypothetical protein [Bacteroides finegoldii]